jgi:hypothetical protein
MELLIAACKSAEQERTSSLPAGLEDRVEFIRRYLAP